MTKRVYSLTTAGIAVLSSILLSSCATTDDPHKGGLIGYLATGEEGYEQRIEKKEYEKNAAESKAEHEERKTSALQSHRNDMMAKLEAQREELDQLEAQTQQMLAETKALKSVADEKKQEQQNLLASIENVQTQIGAVQGDSSMLIAEKQKRIDELKGEVNQLLELYSLLTSM